MGERECRKSPMRKRMANGRGQETCGYPEFPPPHSPLSFSQAVVESLPRRKERVNIAQGQCSETRKGRPGGGAPDLILFHFKTSIFMSLSGFPHPWLLSDNDECQDEIRLENALSAVLCFHREPKYAHKSNSSE